MNLKGIRQRIERDIRHAPNVQAHRDEIVDRVNDAMVYLLNLEPWDFRSRHKLIRLKKKQTSVSFGSNPTIDGVSNTYGISFTDSVSSGIGMTAADIDNLPGHLVTFASATTGLNESFVIERAIKGSALDFNIILDPRYEGHTSLAGDETLTLDWQRYMLPEDLQDLYGVMLRSTEDGRVLELSLGQESGYMLNRDDPAGTPQVMILDPNRATLYDNRSAEYYPHDIAQPPINRLTATSATVVSGAMSAGDTYEYSYAWEYAGMVSEPTPPVQVTIAAGNDGVNLTNLDKMGTAAAQYGRVKRIYRRQIFSDYEGPWQLLDSITNSSTSTYTDTGATSSAPIPTTLRRRRFNPEGTPRFVRFWPATDTDMEVEVRYLASVPLVEHDNDVPEFPGAYHQILVHLVVAELARAADAHELAAAHDRIVFGERGLYNSMRRMHLGSSATRFQRKAMLRGGGGTFPRLIAQPSYTSDA